MNVILKQVSSSDDSLDRRNVWRVVLYVVFVVLGKYGISSSQNLLFTTWNDYIRSTKLTQ
jgi:hypothetical protein